MWHRLRAKPLSYWLISALILAGTILAWPTVDARLNLADAKSALFMLLTQSVTNPSTPRNVKLIMIGDGEYWGPELQHRSPTNRFYLARVMRAADAADASVVALDFDLRLSVPAETVKPGDFRLVDGPYRAETDALMRAIAEIAERRRIVLAKTIEGPVGGPFTLVADAYQAYGICAQPLEHGRWANPGTRDFPLSPTAQANISCGYIALMPDKREVPPIAPLVGTTVTLDPLSLALARARDPSVPARYEHGHFYASFIPEAALESPAIAVDSGRLLRDPRAAGAVLQGYPVIIGARWHLRGPGQGDQVDTHETPIGITAGTLIHSNLAEAMLAGRTYPALSHEAMLAIEIAIGAGAAILFALVASPLLATLALMSAVPVLLAIQWLSLQVFGTFLDLFAPVLGLGFHAIIDRLIGGVGHGPPHGASPVGHQ